MKIKLICEWCDKVMKTVSTFEKVRDAQQKGETVCSTCLKKVAKVEGYFATLRQKYESRVDGLIKELKKDFRAGLRKGDFDDGKNLQDVGRTNKDT